MNIRDHMRGTKGPPTACDGVDGFSEALTTLINFCVDMLENDSAVVPNEKYSLLRVRVLHKKSHFFSFCRLNPIFSIPPFPYLCVCVCVS